MAKKKKAKALAPTPNAATVSTTPELGLSTRNRERPKGSIRIVPGRKDAK